jgi:high-affinity nickel permease
MILPSLSGLVAGTVHVVSGPDHLAAIAPLSAEGKTGSWRIGFRWGLGHSSGVLLVGLISLLLREVLP